MFEHIRRRDRMDDENMGFISTKTRWEFHNNLKKETQSTFKNLYSWLWYPTIISNESMEVVSHKNQRKVKRYGSWDT